MTPVGISNMPNVLLNTPLSPEATLPPTFNTINYGDIGNGALAVTNIPPSLSSVIAPTTFSQIPTLSSQIVIEQPPLRENSQIVHSQSIPVRQANPIIENAQLKEDPVIPNIFPKIGERQYSPEVKDLFKASEMVDNAEALVRLSLSGSLLDINDRIPLNASPEYIRTLQARVAERLQPLLEGSKEIIAKYAGKEGVGDETNMLLGELKDFITHLNQQSVLPQAAEPSVAQIKSILVDLSDRFKYFPYFRKDYTYY